jgi:hypothetical protein
MNDRAGITSTSNISHEEMKQTALKRDEEQVQALVNHLSETMTDPFVAFMCSNVFNFD